MQNELKLRLATIDDLQDLLDWRNDKLTRENSFNSSPVSYNDHCNWFNSSLENNNREIYIIESGIHKIGTLRTDDNGDDIEISWTIAPNFRGQGLAAEALKMLLKEKNRYIAKIKKTNIASIKVALKSGMKELHSSENVITFTCSSSNLI